MTLILGASLFWGGFFVGFLTMRNHAVQMIRDGGSKKKEKTTEPQVGSRWTLRGHDGDVLLVKGNTLCFVDDKGNKQVVPVDYFKAVAQPVASEWN